MIYIPPGTRPQFEQAVRHLHTLGPRATAEALAEIANRIGGFPAILGVLNDYRRLSPEMLLAAGEDRFPQRPLNRVPA